MHTGMVNFQMWSNDSIFIVLRELAHFHAHFLGRTDEVKAAFEGHLKEHLVIHNNALPLFKSFLPGTTDQYKDIITSKHVAIIKEYFANLGAITKEQEKYPLTFVHNDAHIGKSRAGRSSLRIYNVILF